MPCIPRRCHKYIRRVTLTALLIQGLTTVLFANFGNLRCHCKTNAAIPAPRGNIEPLIEHEGNTIHSQSKVSEEKSWNITDEGRETPTLSISLDSVPNVDLRIRENDKEKLSDEMVHIAEKPGDPKERKDMTKGALYEKPYVNKELVKNGDDHILTWLVQLFPRIFVLVLWVAVSYAFMICVEKLRCPWFKYKQVVACLFAILFALTYTLFESYYFDKTDCIIVTKANQQIDTLKANIRQKEMEYSQSIHQCNMSLRNASKRLGEYAVELENCTKMQEDWCRENVKKVIVKITNYTRTVTEENANISRLLLSEMKRNISQQDEMISQKDKAIAELTKQQESELGKMQTDVEKLKLDIRRKESELGSRNNELRYVQDRNGELNNQIIQLQREIKRKEEELQWFKNVLYIMMGLVVLLCICFCLSRTNERA